MIYFVASDSFDFGAPLFALDAELSESASDSLQLSQYPIESGQQATPFAALEPRKFRVSGRVTATPLGGDWDEQRVADLHDAIRAIHDAREVVTLCARFWCVDVLITSVDATMNSDTGLALDLEIGCQTVFRPRPRYTEIPAELLAEPVRSSATPEPVGGAAVGQDETGSDETARKSIAKGIADGDYGDLGGFFS